MSLTFNLSRRDREGPSWLRMAALIGMTGLFCTALLVAFDQEQVRQPEAAPAGFTSNPEAIGEVAGLGSQVAEDEPKRHERSYERQATRGGHFGICGRQRTNCVVDGDTLWLDGVKIRLADIDAPEIGRPRCLKELELGRLATARLVDLLNQGEFTVMPSSSGDVDRYGRKLRVLVRRGDSLGEQLVREGLAHRWGGRKLPWC